MFRNYDHVASLWEEKGWISNSVKQTAEAHYSAYSVNRGDGLRIITLNTDLCMYFGSYSSIEEGLIFNCRVHVRDWTLRLICYQYIGPELSFLQRELFQLYQHDPA